MRSGESGLVRRILRALAAMINPDWVEEKEYLGNIKGGYSYEDDMDVRIASRDSSSDDYGKEFWDSKMEEYADKRESGKAIIDNTVIENYMAKHDDIDSIEDLDKGAVAKPGAQTVENIEADSSVVIELYEAEFENNLDNCDIGDIEDI